MIILNSKSKNFDKTLDNLLSQRKEKLESSSVSVTKIINDVKRNGDEALLKYERNIFEFLKRMKFMYSCVCKINCIFNVFIKRLN